MDLSDDSMLQEFKKAKNEIADLGRDMRQIGDDFAQEATKLNDRIDVDSEMTEWEKSTEPLKTTAKKSTTKKTKRKTTKKKVAKKASKKTTKKATKKKTAKKVAKKTAKKATKKTRKKVAKVVKKRTSKS